MFMNPVVIAGILKRVYPKFDMLSFSNRLTIQKFIYLMDAYGLNLGYRFSLYLYGPYSTELTKDAFQIREYNTVKPLRFEDDAAEENFVKFIRFLNPHKKDVEWLELAASIHFLIGLHGKSKAKVLSALHQKRASYSVNKGEFGKVWVELENEALI